MTRGPTGLASVDLCLEVASRPIPRQYKPPTSPASLHLGSTPLGSALPCNLPSMGRGKNWDSDENSVLAGAWIAASEYPEVGTAQTRKIFQDTVRRRFIEKGPAIQLIPDGKYGSRGSASIMQHFSDISADAQKFSSQKPRFTHAILPGLWTKIIYRWQ